MGFWGSVWSGICRVGEWVSDNLGDIISVGKKILEWIGVTNELKKAPKYDERNATMDETFKISELLEKQRNGFSQSISTLEQGISNSAKLQLDNLIDLAIKLNESFDTSINISYLKKQFHNFLESIKNSLSDKVNQKIQISDPECSQLLKLEGSERETKIDAYIKKIINQGIENYIKELKSKINETVELVEDVVQEKLAQKNKDIEFLMKEIDNAKIQDNLKDKNAKKIELLEKEREINNYIALLTNRYDSPKEEEMYI